MGMFDNVKYECVCPVCHGKVDDFQSKDGDCVLETITPHDVLRFYDMCDKCGCWIEFKKVKGEIDRFKRSVTGKYTGGKRPKLEEHDKVIRIKYTGIEE